jgi:uncharacterized protein (TIGR02453 family)
MLEASTLQFLKNLKKNNKKEWFDANRSKYENAKQNFENFAQDLLRRLCRIDETIAHLQPKDCMFRINRDVRFSKNKSPHKTNFALYISKGGKKGFQPGYYFHLEPGGSFVAGGLWMPMPPELKKVRQEIDYNWDEFKKIISNKKFKTAFGDIDRSEDIVLSRPPKGYGDDNPAVEYLKLKSLIVMSKVPDSSLTLNTLAKEVTSKFEVMKPLINFLTRAVED